MTTPPRHWLADAVLGTDLRDCLVLASHPDERRLPGGLPSTTRRTLVLSFDGREARPVATLPEPLLRAWTSDNGTGYAAPAKGGWVYLHRDGRWTRETVSDQPETVFHLWGLSGADAAADTVFLSTGSGLFVRQLGRWALHPLPAPARKAYGVHGLAADEVHVCSDQVLLLWNGQGLEPVQGPDADLLKHVLVLPDAVLGGGDRLLQWTPSTGWQRLRPGLPDVMAMLNLPGRHLFAGTFAHGIHERRDGVFTQVTPDFMCLSLQAVGDAAFARGKHGSHVWLDGAWSPLSMPAVEADVPPDAPA